MLSMIAVFTSNEVNLYGNVFTVGSLESALSQSWQFGTPSLISHDQHRPIGWSRGLSVHLEPSLARLTGLSFMAENSKEIIKIADMMKGRIYERIDKDVKPDLSILESKLKSFLIGSEKAFNPDCTALIDKGLAIRAFKDLFALKDKDGLISINFLEPIAPGVFKKDDLLLFAHPYFRRSQSFLNTLNYPFFETLLEVSNSKSKLDIRIALDEDMVGLASSLKEHFELEYWWGPEFSDDLSMIDIGVTRHNADENLRLFHGVSATEFWWYEQNNLKVFECEEIRELPSYGDSNDKYGCRFVHTILGAESGTPNHMDGAVRTYDEVAIIERSESKMSEFGKNSIYKKLWRIDGDLKVEEWKKLLTHYYRDNILIGEYLGGKDVNQYVGHQIPTYSSATVPLLEFVPCNMEESEGIRISVSYHERSNNKSNGREIQVFDSLSRDSDRFDYVESDTIELIKILKKANESIVLPKGTSIITFEDRVVNLPLILHTGPEGVDLTRKTQDAIKQLCEVFERKNDDRLISFNLGVEYSEQSVYFSIAGHVKDVVIWLKKIESIIPENVDQLGDWLESNYELITKSSPKANDHPSLSEMLTQTGLLIFKRKYLLPEEYKMGYDENEKAIICSLSIKKDQTDQLELLNSGQLTVASAFIINESKCSKCKESYLLCDCSKYVDSKIYQVIEEMKPMGTFWTNRKA